MKKLIFIFSGMLIALASNAQIISTIAGNGTPSYSGDGGAAGSANLHSPKGVALDALGNIYIADAGNYRIRKVSVSTGIITTVAGIGTSGYSGDGGAATSAKLGFPNGIAIDALGNIYIADAWSYCIRKVTVSTGIITTVAGNGISGYSGDGGAATSAKLNSPYGVAVDAFENIYIADYGDHRVRKVNASTGIISTVAGNGTAGYTGDDMAATSTQLNFPYGVAVDATGNIYIADKANNRIRQVNAGTGNITTVAGTGTAGFFTDGVAATSALLMNVGGVVVDVSGNIYFSNNQQIPKINANNGIITTVAGQITGGYSGDGNSAISAQLNYPTGVALDATGNIYIADVGNNRIRKVTYAVADAPTITSFSPSNGSVGTLVTITGTNLGNPTAFTIGGTSAIVVSNTGTSLVGLVMPGVTTGAVSVSTGGGSASSAGNFTVTPTPFPGSQQGNKLVGTGATGKALQGNSVSVSADGNTAIVGGSQDNSNVGAVWIYSRTNGVWSQQGSKLVGTGAVGNATQGGSVSISADGNTAIVGGSNDNGGAGAVWIFTRSGSVWSQQGNKLVGVNGDASSNQGSSVSISADGNTAIVGGFYDNNAIGAAWIFTRSGGVWTQQGTKLVGAGSDANGAEQGTSVSISSDGNTVIIGGYTDNSLTGAAWIFNRSNGIWTQQGNKLVGTGAIGNAAQGISVSISSDGNTAVVGGSSDNNGIGAIWVFVRSGGVWSQQGSKLVGTGVLGGLHSDQGISVSISADGNTAIVGSDNDNIGKGAVWVFTRLNAVWTQKANKLIGICNELSYPHQGTSLALSSDGSTAIVGGPNDEAIAGVGTGAAWVFTITQIPTITSFTPTSGASGATVTITGTNLTGTSAVSIGGTVASSFNVVNATTVTAVVGSGTTGTVSLTTPGGTAVSSGTFTFIPAPTITSFTPTGGANGATVTITGTNLTGTSAVSIGGTSARSVTVVNANTVTAVVGSGTTGTISLTTPGGTAVSSGTFTFNTAPTITSFTPGNGCTGSTITLTGTGFTGATTVSFGGTAASSFTVNSDTQITAVYGSGVTGKIAVTTPGGTISSSTSFIVGSSYNTYAYIANYGSNSVSVINAATNAVTATVAVGVSPYGVSVSPDGSKVYVANLNSNNVSVINTATNAVIATVAVGTNPNGVSVSPDGSMVYVTNQTSNTMSVINTATNAVTATIAVGTTPQGVSVSSDGNKVYVVNYSSSNVSVINTATNTVTATIAVGNSPVGACISPDGSMVYVTNQTSSTMSVINTATNTVTATVAVGSSPNGVCVSPNGSKVYVANGGSSVSIINTATNTVTATVAVGINPFGVSVSPDGSKVYVTDYSSSNVSVINTTTNVVIATVAVGAVPISLGNFIGNVVTPCVAAAPTITSFTPSLGAVGTLVTITGTDLGNPTDFTIGGTSAIVVSNTGTSLVGLVMPGAISGSVSITTADGTANGTGNFTVTPTPYPSAQQGSKLVGTGSIGNANQGSAIAVSADGNTAIVGGYSDNGGAGAIWVYTRSGGVWSQQGDKLVGSGAVGVAGQGISISISADGNTAIVGGSSDNGGAGAAWVFTRTGGVWSQQGLKLVGSNGDASSYQGSSVSISADGNTAIVGGFYDNNAIGAAWIFTRSGGVWTQQGTKLVGAGSDANGAEQGTSVSISSNGNTVIVGGYTDNSLTGAAWIFNRTNGIWTQQGNKLVGTGAIGNAAQGTSVSISSDGNTAVVGGSSDNNGIGAIWVFVRSGGVWSQQGSKLFGTGALGPALQGSVSISADGNTIIVVGSSVNSSRGAVWLYTRSGGIWTQQGSKLVGTGAIGAAFQVTSVSLSTDGNTAIIGDGNDNGSAGAAWVYIVTPAPTITSFTPTSGANGTTVTITGTNFTGTSAVTFGGTEASLVTVVDTNTVMAVVGNGTTGTISLTTPGGTAVSSGTFTFIPAPTITSFTPIGGANWTTVTITGTNLTGATAVSIGGTSADSVTVVNATTVTAVVTTGTTGTISITTPGGTAVSSGTFTVGKVYNATVPVFTKACYISGTMNGWTFQEMNKVDSTHYTLDMGVATVSDTYKYYSGPGLKYVESDINNNDIPNRNYAANDIVIKWKEIYEDVNTLNSMNIKLIQGKSFFRAEFDGNARIEVYNLSGVMLKQANATNTITVNNLNTGLYIVKINGTAFKVLVE